MGCGESGPRHGQPLGPQNLPPARIQVNHVLARAVPSSIDSFRFTGADVNGQVVFGPVTVPRTATVLLEPVPLTCVGFQIEYLTNGVVVGIYREAVQLQSGQTYVIDGPPWQDVGSAGAPARLGFVGQPTAGAPGLVLNPVVTVAILDVDGNLVDDSTLPVTLSVASGPGRLGGTLTVNAVDGVATFADLTLSAPGTYTLGAASTGLTGDTSNDIVISAAPIAAGLGFSVQPANAPVATILAPAVQVQVLDQFGNLFTGFNGPVTLALGNNPVAAVLSGTLTVNAVNGVATFSDLRVSRVGTGFTLIASGDSLTPGTSNPFNVTAAPFDRGARSLVATIGAAAGGTTALDVGDINGDGRLDVLTVSTTDNDYYLLTQTAEGDFTIFEDSVANGRMARFGDCDADGDLDFVVLVAPLAGGFEALLYLNDGNGNYAPTGAALPVSGPGGFVNDLRLGDLNGDGRADLVVSGSVAGNQLTSFLSDGTGFGAPLGVTLGGFSGDGLVLANLAGDANLDAAVAGNDQVNVLIGQGDGTFTLGPSQASLNATGLAVGNVDGVAGLDLVSLGTDGTLRVFLSNDAGGFDLGFGPVLGPAAVGNQGVACGDLNGDGLADVVQADPFLGTFEIRLAGAGGAVLGAPVVENFGLTPRAFVVADLNADGLADVGGVGLQDIFARLNGVGDGTLLPVRDIGYDEDTGAVGDVNGDGRPDLVIHGSRAIKVYLAPAAGPFPTIPSIQTPIVDDLQAIQLADSDGNGSLDLFGTSTSRLGTLIYLNDGNGNFTEDSSQFLEVANRIAVGDLNGDGRADRVGCAGNNNFHVELSTSMGVYAAPVNYPVADAVLDVQVSDFDQDGDPDVVVAANGAGVQFWTNDGAGNLTPPVAPFLGSDRSVAVAVGDVNQDGVPDLLVGTESATDTGGAAVLTGDGQGGVASTLLLNAPEMRTPHEVAVGDVNGDSLPDLVITDQVLFGASLYVNQGDGTFSSGATELHIGGSVNFFHRQILFVDTDGDGQLELLFIRRPLLLAS